MVSNPGLSRSRSQTNWAVRPRRGRSFPTTWPRSNEVKKIEKAKFIDSQEAGERRLPRPRPVFGGESRPPVSQFRVVGRKKRRSKNFKKKKDIKRSGRVKVLA